MLLFSIKLLILQQFFRQCGIKQRLGIFLTVMYHPVDCIDDCFCFLFCFISVIKLFIKNYQVKLLIGYPCAASVLVKDVRVSAGKSTLADKLVELIDGSIKFPDLFFTKAAGILFAFEYTSST